MENQGRYLIDINKIWNVHVFLQKNFIETYDHWFLQLFPSREDEFYRVGRVLEDYKIKESNPGNLFTTFYWIHPEIILHEREVYYFVNLFEDLGGIIEIMIVAFSLVLLPISDFSFNLKAIK